MEDNNSDTKINDSKDTNLLTDNSKGIVREKRKRRLNNSEIESKQLAEEECNREIQEQQYKRLMHLLNRSKFYASFIINKINSNLEENTSKVTKKDTKKIDTTKENIPPQEKVKKKTSQSYDIQNYISENVQRKINLKKDTLNLGEEKIENELINSNENEEKSDNNNVIETLQYFNGNLRNYQKEGFQWLKVLYENGINGILADEMGLGKTIQVIALLSHLIEKQQNGPYLIIAPLSTIPNWMIEFERFAPRLPVILFYGAPNERLMLQRKIKQKHRITETYSTQPIVLTTFEVTLYEKNFMKSQNWRYIIIDEGHRIKNHKCLLIQTLKQCKSMNRLLLTGTPLQNNLAELWSLLNFLLPEIFNDLAVFESWFDAKELQHDEGAKKFFKLEEEKHVLSTLREILQPFMLRREKSDVCLDIPPKKELVVYAPLTRLQHDLYKAVLNRDIYTLNKTEETLIIDTEDDRRPKRKCVLKNTHITSKYFEREASPSTSLTESDKSTNDDWKQVKSGKSEQNLSIWKQFTNVTECNQDFLINIKYHNTLLMYKRIVNHPYLVYCPLGPDGLPRIDEDLVKSSGKLLVLDAMLPKLKNQKHKVLLFSTMKVILDIIEDYLLLRNYKYVRLDGSTSLEERKENIKNFNTNTDVFLFLISTRAGGVGLNLLGADTVIIYDSDWNPQVDIQAMARCHRIGQRRPVVIYKLCTKGTIDEVIINRAEAKRLLEKVVISKQNNRINLNSKHTLTELQRLLHEKEGELIASENEAFTEEELNKLLDRSDMYINQKNS